MFWRAHRIKPDPKSMRAMPLCLWGVQTRLGFLRRSYLNKLVFADLGRAESVSAKTRVLRVSTHLALSLK
jgi:cAMP phosphodiesterase